MEDVEFLVLSDFFVKKHACTSCRVKHVYVYNGKPGILIECTCFDCNRLRSFLWLLAFAYAIFVVHVIA